MLPPWQLILIYILSMKKFKKYKFKTFKALENFFEKKILPYKNYRSKVIGKTIYVWKRKAA